MFSFGNIYDLAELAVTRFGLKGIDWTALAVKGRSSVWDRNYITEYLTPAWGNMNLVAVTLDLNPSLTPEEMKEAYGATASALNAAAGSITRLFGLPILEGQVELQLTRDVLRKVITMLVQSGTYAFMLHSDETIHHSDLSDNEVRTHANICCGILNSITLLDSLGFFTAIGLKKQAPAQSGLGIAPILIVAGIAALCVLAWAIVQCVSLNKTNDQIANMCNKAQTDGDQATIQTCLNTLASQNAAAGQLPVTLIKQILSSVMPYALAGGAIYIGLLFAPSIITQIMAPKRA